MSVATTVAETTAAAADTTAESSTDGQAESTASADTLRVILNSEPSNLDPHNNTRLTAWAVQEEIFDDIQINVVTEPETWKNLTEFAEEEG